MITIPAWLATALVLGAYAARRRPSWFDWANATLWPLIALPSVLGGIYHAAVISLVFGVIATMNLVRRKGRS